MSGAAVRWVDRHSPTKGSQRAVLRALALKADDSGRDAYPTWAWLEKRTGCSRATVWRALGALRAQGVIRRHVDCVCDACQRAALMGSVVYDVVLGIDELVDAGQEVLELGVTQTPVDVSRETSHQSHGETGPGFTLKPFKGREGTSNGKNPSLDGSPRSVDEPRFGFTTAPRGGERGGVGRGRRRRGSRAVSENVSQGRVAEVPPSCPWREMDGSEINRLLFVWGEVLQAVRVAVSEAAFDALASWLEASGVHPHSLDDGRLVIGGRLAEHHQRLLTRVAMDTGLAPAGVAMCPCAGAPIPMAGAVA